MIPSVTIGAAFRQRRANDPNWANVKLRAPMEMGGGGDTRDHSSNRFANSANSITATLPGKFGAYKALFGAGGYIQYGSAANWNFLHNGTKWTIDFWLAPSYSAIRTILSTGSGTTTAAAIYIAVGTDRKITIQIYRAVAASFVLTGTVATALPNDADQHFVRMTYDPDAGSNHFTAYADGSSLGSLSRTGNAHSSADAQAAIRLGNTSNGSQDYSGGTQDDVVITSGVILSGSEVPWEARPVL